MRLSPHFTLEELTYSETAARLGIKNEPDAEQLANLGRLAAGLERVRELLGKPIRVSSGFRCPELNARVPGSSKTSAHCLGLAADILVTAFGSPLDVCLAIAQSGIKFDQVIHEYGAWTHISFAPAMRQVTTTKCTGKPYEAGLFPCK